MPVCLSSVIEDCNIADAINRQSV